MGYSPTGTAYLILFFALGFLTFRFFRYRKQKKDVISKCFLFFVFFFATFAFLKAVICIFFINNTQILTFSTVLGVFLQYLAFASIAYLVIYIKFPNIFPWIGFSIFILLGLLTTYLTANLSIQPFINPSGAISWNIFSSNFDFPYFILRFGIILITFLALITVTVHEYKSAEDALLRKRTLGLIIIFSLVILLGFLDFFLIDLLKLDAIMRDIGFIILSILIFIIALSTQKPPKKKEKPMVSR